MRTSKILLIICVFSKVYSQTQTKIILPFTCSSLSINSNNLIVGGSNNYYSLDNLLANNENYQTTPSSYYCTYINHASTSYPAIFKNHLRYKAFGWWCNPVGGMFPTNLKIIKTDFIGLEEKTLSTSGSFTQVSLALNGNSLGVGINSPNVSSVLCFDDSLHYKWTMDFNSGFRTLDTYDNESFYLDHTIDYVNGSGGIIIVDTLGVIKSKKRYFGLPYMKISRSVENKLLLYGTTNYNKSVYVSEIDSMFNIKWSKSYIIEDSIKVITLQAYSYGFNTTFFCTKADSSLSLFKIDSIGNLVNNFSIVESNKSLRAGKIINYNNLYYLTYSGSSEGPILFTLDEQLNNSCVDKQPENITVNNYSLLLDEDTSTYVINYLAGGNSISSVVNVSASQLHNTVCSEVSINEFTNNLISILPNPANDNITIESSMAFNEISIVDYLGRKVHSGRFSNNITKANIQFNSIENGVYFCRIYNDKNIVGIKKIVVAKD